MIHELEIAPGVFFSGKNGQFKLLIKASQEEIIAWDWGEIKNDPQEWFSSLKIVALAVQHGPTIALRRVKEAKAEKQTPAGTLLCNICNTKFVVGPGYPFIFTAKLNGKNYCDYQCSEICNKTRREMVFKNELGENFVNEFPKSVTRNKTT
ncbi:hypothetical protein C4588_05605 [Candidatus Parcubacteria bacterium]|nr:MAG: hypothetical protein C4588_05605 [Candidatus Parcubacteria bacterium]